MKVDYMVDNRPIERVCTRHTGADLPRDKALQVLQSLGSVLEPSGRRFWTMDPFRFRYEHMSPEGNRIGKVISLRTGDLIAYVHYGQTLELDVEAYDRHLTDPKGIHSIVWVSTREQPELEELDQIAAVYPSATVTHSQAPLNLHSVSQFVEHYSTQEGTLVLFDTAQNVRLMMYLMQLQLPFAFLEKDNGGVLTVYFVIKGKLTVVRPVNG